jgi:hypothetical protein
MNKSIYSVALLMLFVVVHPALSEDVKLKNFRGVVSQLLPAKVLKII